MACSWEKVTFGRTGLQVSPIGLGSSYGVGGKDVERAFDRGINFFFWGMFRRHSFGRGVRHIAAKDRDKVVIAVQSYTRVASLMRPSLEVALRSLKVDHVDLLCVAWWDHLPAQRIVDAAYALRDQGKVKHLLISSHHRPSFVPMLDALDLGGIMVRYNAAHPGAEQEVFPYLKGRNPGVLSFTATRWGTLLKPHLLPSGLDVARASDCYRFALSNPNVHTTLAGPSNGAQLDEALSALDRGPLREEEQRWMRAVGKVVRASTGNTAVGWVDRLRGALWKRPTALPSPAATPLSPANDSERKSA